VQARFDPAGPDHQSRAFRPLPPVCHSAVTRSPPVESAPSFSRIPRARSAVLEHSFSKRRVRASRRRRGRRRRKTCESSGSPEELTT
jgi:hypothetical protein